MANLNKVFLMGNLTRDPEIRYTEAGRAITKFGLAVNRKVKDPNSEQWRDEVDFIDVTAFGRTGEVISEYLRKGSPIFIEGRLNFNSWETPNGERRSKLDVVAENFQFIGAKGAHTEGAPAASERPAPAGGPSGPPKPPPSESSQGAPPPKQPAPPPYDENAPSSDKEVPF